jgi:hypothetical protein
MTTRNESWKGKGDFTVTRDARGRFVKWIRYVEASFTSSYKGSSVAVYGRARTSRGTSSCRIELVGGGGKDLYHAISWIVNHPPRERFTTVNVNDLLSHPWNYTERGYWLEKSVES